MVFQLHIDTCFEIFTKLSCFVCCKNFPVDKLLEGKATKRFDGAALVQKLKAGIIYQPQERSFLTKTVCRYLMAHCQM